MRLAILTLAALASTQAFAADRWEFSDDSDAGRGHVQTSLSVESNSKREMLMISCVNGSLMIVTTWDKKLGSGERHVRYRLAPQPQQTAKWRALDDEMTLVVPMSGTPVAQVFVHAIASAQSFVIRVTASDGSPLVARFAVAGLQPKLPQLKGCQTY